MLNIGGLNQGIVIDHIQVGGAMKIYEYLNLEKLDCSVAIIKNAKSNKMGKKDIIKIEGDLDIDLNVLGVLDHSITINIIKDAEIVEKHQLSLPDTVTNIYLYYLQHMHYQNILLHHIFPLTLLVL